MITGCDDVITLYGDSAVSKTVAMAHTIYTRYGLMLYSTYTVDKLVQYTILLSIKVPTICISLASPIKAFNMLRFFEAGLLDSEILLARLSTGEYYSALNCAQCSIIDPSIAAPG